jgi:plasmid stabilization system protein ParE
MERHEVLWAESAVQDLEDLVSYIALDSTEQARQVLQRLRSRSSKLESLPERGRIVPELEDLGLTAWRELIEGPWRILYRISKRRVFVEAILDSRRDIAAVLAQRLGPGTS